MPYAPRVTYKALSGSDKTLTIAANAQSVKVEGFTLSYVSNSGNDTVTVATTESTPTTLGVYFLLGGYTNSNTVMRIPFLADKGLKFTAATGTYVRITVFHHNIGT